MSSSRKEHRRLACPLVTSMMPLAISISLSVTDLYALQLALCRRADLTISSHVNRLVINLFPMTVDPLPN